jgi:hypothetical protein
LSVMPVVSLFIILSMVSGTSVRDTSLHSHLYGTGTFI